MGALVGVDLTATISVEGTPVCEVWCGRYYHWRDALDMNLDGGPFTTDYWWLRDVRKMPIHEHKVKDTDVSVIAKALAKKFGERNVKIKWEAW